MKLIMENWKKFLKEEEQLRRGLLTKQCLPIRGSSRLQVLAQDDEEEDAAEIQLVQIYTRRPQAPSAGIFIVLRTNNSFSRPWALTIMW